MEGLPQPNEQGSEAERPALDIDLSGPDGNVFTVVSMARQVLADEARKEFNQAIWEWEATEAGSGKTYTDILALVNAYADLLDTSDTYPQYGPEAHITAAIDRLNERVRGLPSHIACDIADIYPEFDNPDLGPDQYGLLLSEEVERVEGELGQCGEDDREHLLELRTHLVACAGSLKRAGVEW